MPSSDLAPERVLPLLETRRLGRPYELLATCGSTNDEVRSRAKALAPEGLLVAAEVQTRGRGRLGRLWQSSLGENLCFSLLLRPCLAARLAAPLTLVAGVALARALAAAGAAPRLKWPNDVLLPEGTDLRKVAGILTEMASDNEQVRYVVLGVGLNVNQREFGPDLAARATSLGRVLGTETDRARLLASFLAALEPLYDSFLRGGFGSAVEEWRRLACLPQPCRVQQDGAPVQGLAVDVDETGALLVRDGRGGTHRVLSGEVG